MAQIENPIFEWFKSKRAMSDNPISWWVPSPKRHYAKFKYTVSGISDEELKKERTRYDHNTRTDFVITSLAMAAEVGGAALLAPHVEPRVILFSAGPAAVAACFVGITRGIIRDGEKGILQEEIERRLQVTSGTVYSAPKEV